MVAFHSGRSLDVLVAECSLLSTSRVQHADPNQKEAVLKSFVLL